MMAQDTDIDPRDAAAMVRKPRTITRIRALTSPHEGATFTLDPGQQLLIGREDGCDLQILDAGVSRRHAAITCDDQGNYALEDLGSGNGTFIDRQSIHRVALRPGQIFEIMRHRYRFIVEEIVTPSPADTTEAFAPTPARRAAEHTLVNEITRYRSLRTRAERGEAQPSNSMAELTTLWDQLTTPGVDGSNYRDFECSVDATLRSFDGPEQRVRITEIGVDGATIDGPRLSVKRNSLLWLVVETKSATCMFLARRISTDDDCVRLTFAGSNDWHSRRSRPSTTETTRPFGSFRASVNAASEPVPMVCGEINC